ncbi:hypothetical protein BDZ88DRAFT_509867, partial [Geranomyces variabilis]
MTINTALPEVSNEDFNQVLDDIRARYPRRKFDLRFKDPQLESTFVDYYAVRMIEKNKFVALMTGTGLAVFPIAVFLTNVRRTWIADIPILYAGSLVAIGTFLVLKYAAPRWPAVLRNQHHIMGGCGALCLANIVVNVEAAFVSYSLDGYDEAIFDSKIRHLSIMTLYIGLASTHTGMRWTYVSALIAVLGNYLVLTLGNHARAQDYTSSLVAYTFASVTAITEAYLLEGKARDVFLMERIVADAQAVNADLVGKSGDLVDSIRRARLRRAGISEIDHAAEVRPWQDGHRNRDIAEYSCGQQESGISGGLDRKSLLVLQPLAEVEDAEVGLETTDDPPARLAPAGEKRKRQCSIAGLRSLGRRWWKNVYLAWPDEYHEENYLRWQNRSFGFVYGMAIFLQCVSLISHFFIDMNTFCKPTIRGRQSTYLCENPGPDHLRHIYIYFFAPTLAVAIVVATFPIIGVHPTTTHRCAALAFALLFSGYTWLTIEASQVIASFEGMSYSDSSYEMFDAYSINVLIAAGGCSALPSHWYQALLFFAFLTRTFGALLGLSLAAVMYDSTMLVCVAGTAGVLVTERERLARRYHALRGVFIDRCRDGGLVVGEKINRRPSVLGMLGRTRK